MKITEGVFPAGGYEEVQLPSARDIISSSVDPVQKAGELYGTGSTEGAFLDAVCRAEEINSDIVRIVSVESASSDGAQ